MTKQRRGKSHEITLPGVGFLGIPLFFGRLGSKFRLEMVREAGKHIARFANGTHGHSIFTTNGWSDSTEGDRQMLIRWLSKLPKLPPRMLTEIADYAKQVEPQSTEIVSRVKNGRIELRAITNCLPPASNVAYGYVMASLLSAGHGENFGKCPECSKWFFDIPSGRPMKKFCNKKHANRHRQRRFQEKRK